MRDMHELGLNSENCEHWLERAIVALVGIMFILLVIRVRDVFFPMDLSLISSLE
jgi:hypothetical protein